MGLLMIGSDACAPQRHAGNCHLRRRQRRRFTWTLYRSTCVAAILGAGTCAAATNDRSELDPIKDGYRANIAVFTKYRCRFRFAIRSADTEADALAGKWNSRGPQEAVEATLYVKDDMLALRMEIRNDELVHKIQKHDSLITPINIARKGGYAIDHDALVNNAIVHSPQHFDLNVRFHPFNLAQDSERLDPAGAIEWFEARNFEGAELIVEKDVPNEGRRWTRLTTKAAVNSHDTYFYLDPERGFLPFLTVMEPKVFKGPPWRMHLLDVRHDAGGYFPMHAILVIPRVPKTGGPDVEVREMQVLELDLKYEPTDKDLMIELPKYTQYYDGVNPNTSKTLYADAKTDFVPISVNDLEPLYQTLQGLAREREKEQAARLSRPVVQSVRSHRRLYLVLGANGALLVLLIGIVAYRWRGQRHHS